MSDDNNILSFSEGREKHIKEKRRQFERIVFNNFIGVHQEIRKDQLIIPVELIDISTDGCLFQIPNQRTLLPAIEVGEEIVLRMYFTKSTYLPIFIIVKHYRNKLKDTINFSQYGCKFNTEPPSFKAMASFIEFLQNYSEYSSIDRDETKTWFLSR